MIAAPIPSDDAERLAALHELDLLDTPPEERFDRITRLLTTVLGVPMAFVTLVDAERQWFKSVCGINASETPRSVSFCGHALLSDGPLVVPDAAEDERFHDNPLVTGEPFVRFYAGQPLSGPGGHRVGTLCVADRRPRRLSAPEAELLRELSQIVERELGLVEVAHLQRDLIASQRRRLQELAKAARYVRSMLPEPLAEGPVRARWAFEPSSELGGDGFGYGWIDPDHFAVYLLDVAGHGVGPALLSVTVANVLRARSLPDTDFLDPPTVLARLNDAFPMERHDEQYFTIWYGVFRRSDRRLAYCCGGHPPALLLEQTGPEVSRAVELGQPNLAVGMLPDVRFTGGAVTLAATSRLYLFSDGAFEVARPDGSMMSRAELVDHLRSSPGQGPDDVLRFVRGEAGRDVLDDDFCLLELDFS